MTAITYQRTTEVLLCDRYSLQIAQSSTVASSGHDLLLVNFSPRNIYIMNRSEIVLYLPNKETAQKVVQYLDCMLTSTTNTVFICALNSIHSWCHLQHVNESQSYLPAYADGGRNQQPVQRFQTLIPSSRRRWHGFPIHHRDIHPRDVCHIWQNMNKTFSRK